MDNIRLIFVLSEKYSTESEASEVMLQAFEACKQHVKIEVSWIREPKLNSFTLNKTDFVIFEDFKGETFDTLNKTKHARILGPWAISICLMEGKAIPNFPWPIYNVAMYSCIVTSSNLPKSTKLEIKEKVQIMGGCYVDTLVEKITHLVTDNPNSEKYLAAAEAGVTLMCSSWIEAVWTASQVANVHASDKEFEKHCCLPFQNLRICCTGLSGAKERKDLEKLITKYGGKYSAKLNLVETDILVCSGVAGNTSEKYKAARKRSNIKCVDISWVMDSVEKGYALPHNLFPVEKCTSTPTKNTSKVNPDFSVLSAIVAPDISQRVLVEETINVSRTPVCSGSPYESGTSKRKRNLAEDPGQLVDKLDIKKAKSAGQYLDGCTVYVTGFSPEHTEKLCKILNLSGATRYDQFSERVTHVIVGDPTYHEVNIIKSKDFQGMLVSVQWLVDSIDKRQPVNEEMYLLSSTDFDRGDFTSPLGKKGLKLLCSSKTMTEEEIEGTKDKTLVTVENNMENDIIQHYLKPTNTVEEDDTLARLLNDVDNTNFSKQIQEPPKEIAQFRPPDTSTQQSSMSITQDDSSEMRTQAFFEGLKFLVIGFEDTHFEYMKNMIEDFSGELVPKSYKGIPDFIVLPVINKCELRHTATEVVNELFINECAIEGGILKEICYYHRPLDVPDKTPLENCFITISGYSNYERKFLKNVIEALGGQHQDQFARITSKARGVIASTHLVSNTSTGKKYSAAQKWSLPVINKDWLLECAKTGLHVSETDYMVGGDCSVEHAPSGNSDANTNITEKTIDSKTTNNLNFSVPSVPPHTFTPKLSKVDVNSTTKSNTPGISDVRMATPNTPGDIRIMSNNVSKIYTPTESTSVNTPRSSRNSVVLTPIHQKLSRDFDLNDTADKPLSQATPVNKIVQKYRDGSQVDSPSQFHWMGIKTPDTPLGACIRANPSPQSRKECELWLRQFPDFVPPTVRRQSTPLSEIKRQLWDKILNKGADRPQQPTNFESGNSQNENEEIDVATPLPEVMDVAEPLLGELPSSSQENTQNQLINNKLQQLEEMLSASGVGKRQSRNFQSTIPIPEGNNDYKDSQVCTVGWDFREQEVTPKVKIFILSGIGDDTRATMVKHLEKLGAAVSDLLTYDPSGTHLLCPKPARNEKTLSCMAAGKWCLHISYVEKSLKVGHFLDEEEYEFGNPKSVGKFEVKYERDTESRMKSVYWWRKEVARRGYGAFNDMRAIVVAQKKDSIIRVIEAGGGVVIDVSPPFDDTVHATHCLLEQRSIRNFADYVPLAQQGIYVLNTLYISDYLHQPNRDVRECILPYFAKYYMRS